MKPAPALIFATLALISGGRTSAQPANDLCSAVVPVQIMPGGSITFTGSTMGATYPGDAINGPLADGTPKVWHAFTLAACSDVTLAYCGSSMMGSTYIVISHDCPSTSTVFNSGVNTSDCTDGNWTYLYDDLPAGTYYAPVGAFADFLGSYQLTITAVNCNGGTAVANDGCSSVLPVDLAMGTTNTFTGTTVGATYSGDATGGPLADGTPKVWHAFTIGQCADVTVSYCGSSWFGDTYIIISNDCPSTSTVFNSGVNLSDCSDGNWTYQYDGLPAGTYYVPIGAFANALGPYQVNISAVACMNTGVADAISSSSPVFPNPTSGTVHVELPAGIMAAHVVVLDATGRAVLNIPISSNAFTADLSVLAAGHYQLRATNGSGDQLWLGLVVKE